MSDPVTKPKRSRRKSGKDKPCLQGMTPTEAMSLSKLLAKASEMISPLAERENLHARIEAFKTSLKIEEIRLRDGRSKGVSKGGPRASDEGHDGYTG